jgi:hypothetical protein
VWYTDVDSVYFIPAVKAYDGKMIPYQENMEIVYPPAAWWVMYLPRFFDSRHLLNPQDPQLMSMLKSYNWGFKGEMFLCDLASFMLLFFIVKKLRAPLAGWTVLTYTVITAILGHLLYDRLDVGVTFLLLAWAFCWIKSLDPSARSVAWSTAAYAALGLGISYKIIPVMVVPVLLLGDWKAPQRIQRLTTGLIAVTLTTTLPFIIQYVISGPAVFSLFKYHSERGIQVESLYSTLMMIASLFGSDVFILSGYGSYQTSGDLSKLMIGLSTVVMLVFLAATWIWLFFRPTQLSRREGYRLACYTLFATVILAKVLSPQYFIWSLPMSLLLAVDVFRRNKSQPWAFAALWLIVAVLTTWLFPYHYFTDPASPGLVSRNPVEAKILNTVPCVVLALRNFLYFAMAAWLGWLVFRGVRYDSALAQKT